ncbi:putative O-glycosylation ligase, exosortase A system-associated [Magnetospira thiophila]
MRDLFVAALLFASIPLIFYRPFVGILMWSLISYMNPHRLTYGFAHDFPFAMVVGLCTLIAWGTSKESKSLPKHPLAYLLVFFTFWVTLTTVTGFPQTSEASWGKWDRTIKIFLMTYVAMTMLVTRERFHAFVWVIVMALGFYGVKGGIFTVVAGGGGRVLGPPSSLITDNNHLAVALIMILPLIRYLQLHTLNKWVRMCLMGMMGVTALSVVGSFSRGALVAGSAMTFYMFLKSRQKAAIFAAAVVVILIGASIMPQAWFDRMNTIQTYDEDQSASGRFDAWTYGYLVANRHLFGGGFLANQNVEYFMQLVPEAPRARAFHSIYFEVLGEHGWIGLLTFLTIGAVSLMSLNILRNTARGHPNLLWIYDLATMCQVSLVGYAVGGTFLNLAFFDLPYSIFAIVIALQVHCTKAIKEEEERLGIVHVRGPAMMISR